MVEHPVIAKIKRPKKADLQLGIARARHNLAARPRALDGAIGQPAFEGPLADAEIVSRLAKGQGVSFVVRHAVPSQRVNASHGIRHCRHIMD